LLYFCILIQFGGDFGRVGEGPGVKNLHQHAPLLSAGAIGQRLTCEENFTIPNAFTKYTVVEFEIIIYGMQ
jgi:hypothetical protein